MIRIALAYAALLAATVLAADIGSLPRFAEQLHDLPYGDKVLHFTMFGLLALVANLALSGSGRRSQARAIVIGSLFAAFVATAEECSNCFLTHRGWSLGDLAANYAGVVCLGVLPLCGTQLASDPTRGDENDSSDPQPSATR